MLLLHGNPLLVSNHAPRQCWLAANAEEGAEQGATVEVTPPQQSATTKCVRDCIREG